MKKKEKLELKKNIENEEYIEQNNVFVFKKLIFNPLLRAAFMCILLVFSIINHERIARLASLTSNAIFSSEKILGHVTYYVILGVTIGVCFVISLSSLIIKASIDFSSIKILRRAYQVYNVYDMLIFVLSSFVCLFFIIMVLITPCNISGSSMENTYHDGDRVLLWNIGYEAKKNDVIVFDSRKYTNQTDASRFFIKRVIATENDEVSLFNNDLYVNGEFIEILYPNINSILMDIIKDANGTYIVPKNKVLVLGDNRSNSHDSRNFGFIDESEIIGKVLFRFYPFNKIGNPEPDLK